MNNPALKREVSKNKKMLKLTNPRLRRLNVVVNSFHSCVSDATKELSRTPEMSVSEMSSKPRMFFEKFKGAIAFKQLKSFTNTHGCGKLNKQVDVVSSNVQLIDFTLFPKSNLSNKKLTIHSEPIKFKGIHCIFNFPDKMESILSKAMFPRFQIHFLSPEHSSNYVHRFISEGLVSRPSVTNHSEVLNFEGGDSSPSINARVSSPWM